MMKSKLKLLGTILCLSFALLIVGCGAGGGGSSGGGGGASNSSVISTASTPVQAPTVTSYTKEIFTNDMTYTSTAGNITGNNFTPPELFFGNYNNTNYDVFFKFNLSEIPINADIEKAELVFNATYFYGAPTVNIRYCTEDLIPETLGPTTVADYAQSKVSSILFTTNNFKAGINRVDLTSLIKRYVNNELSNYGFVLDAVAMSNHTFIKIAKNDDPDPPKLVVKYKVTGSATYNQTEALPQNNAYAMSSGNKVSVINSTSLKPIKYIQLEGTPVDIAITPDGNNVYVAIIRHDDIKGCVVVINTTTNEIVKRLQMDDDSSCGTLLSPSPDGSKIYVVSPGGNSWTKIWSISTDNYEIKTLKETTPQALSLNEISILRHSLTITPNGEYLCMGSNDRVLVFSTKNNEFVKIISLDMNNYRIMALQPSMDNNKLYVYLYNSINNNNNKQDIRSLNIDTNVSEKILECEDNTAYKMKVSPDDKYLYISDSNSSEIKVLSIKDKRIDKIYNVGYSPEVALSKDNKYLYASNHASHTFNIVSIATNKILFRVKADYWGQAFDETVVKD